MTVRVYIPIYNQYITFLIKPTNAELNRYKVTSTAEDLAKSEACTYSHGIVVFYTNPTVGTIAHETFHAVSYLCKYIGLKWTSDNEEAYAYLIDYVTEEFYKKF